MQMFNLLCSLLLFLPPYLCLLFVGICQAMEEVCGQWVPREGEIPSRVEEQELPTEAVHDESPQARQNDQRCHVRHFCLYNI